MFGLSGLLEKASGLLGEANAAAFLEDADPAVILDQIGVDPAMLDTIGLDPALLEQAGLDPAALNNISDLDLAAVKVLIGQSRP